MAKGDHGFKKKSRGAKGGGYARARTQIGFDDATREKILKWADFRNISFAAMVRELVERGLRSMTR
jgi:hypothetical protein